MTFNFANLRVALWSLHRARIGQRNGMTFFLHDILHEWNLRVDHWARAGKIFPGQSMLLTLQIYLLYAG